MSAYGEAQAMQTTAVHAKASKPWAILALGLTLLWGCFPATVTMAAGQRPSPESGSRTYQRVPAKTVAPVPSSPSAPPAASRPEERRGKYSNPYDRRVPLQGDTHKGYAPARRDAFKR